MPKLSENPKILCRKSNECHYKVNSTCTYWESVKAMLSEFQGKYHPGSNCIIDCIDLFREPCLDPEEEHHYGDTDLLKS